MAAVLTVSGAGVLRTQAEETGEFNEATETTSSEETEESGKQERTVSSGDAGFGTEEKQKLSTPVQVKWGNGWDAWDAAWVGEMEPQGYCEWELYKDGELFQASTGSGHLIGGSEEAPVYSLWDLVQYISDDGVYTFRVKYTNRKDPKKMGK